MVSRILGLVRDVVLAAAFGTGPGAQAFVVAFRMPNLLRDLIAEGATNAAVVPVLSEYARRGREAYWVLVRSLLLGLIPTLVVLTGGGMLLAPWLVRVLAPGFSVDPSKFALTVTLTRGMFPYLLFIGLTAYAAGVLHSQQRFLTASLAQPLFNLAVIGSVWLACPWFREPVLGLLVGVLVGGAVQLGLQVPALYRSGWRLRGPATWRHPGVAQVGRLLLPRALGSCVYQFNLIVDTALASLSGIVGEGAVAALYYANRFMQLPLAVVVVALAQAMLPTLAHQAAGRETSELRRTVALSLRSALFLMIPASVGLVVLARPIVRILFEWKAFTPAATQMTAAVLGCYSVGLVAYAGVRVLASASHALQDTVTPVKAAAVAVAVNVIGSVILMWPYQAAGLALGTALASWANLGVLWASLRRRVGPIVEPGDRRALLWMVLAAAVMAVGAGMGATGLGLYGTALPRWSAALRLGAVIGGAMTVYLWVAVRWQILEARQVVQWMARRGRDR